MESVESETHLDEVLKANPKVVLDVYTKNCAPCKILAPHLETLSKEYTKIKFCKVDASKEDFILEYGIKAVPTLLYFFNAKQVSRTTGMNLPEIKKCIVNLESLKNL